MAAIITSLIGQRNMENIRDRIAVILLAELANQYVLSSTNPKITKVWVERFIPLDGPTEVPTVNVNIASGEWSEMTMKQTVGEYVYNIDVYTNAPSSAADGPGDQLAMVTMNKLVGMIQAILTAPAYNTLLFPTGATAIISGTSVERFFVGDKKAVKDALSDVVARIIFRVRAIEQVEITETGANLTLATTKVLLSNDQGFYYEYVPTV
jgi:hypothetical protein